MLRSIGKALGALLSLLASIGRRRERAEAEETGAIKQREADAQAELEKREEQLDEAVNRRPGDGRRALDRGEF